MKKEKKNAQEKHMVIACTDDLEVNKRILNCAEIDTSSVILLIP
jgi:siroheme synthase (precorrin-2 oxidase/ferrochelatase)